MKNISSKQSEILAYIQKHPEATFTQINDDLKLKSLGVVHYHIKELMLKGRIKKINKWVVK